MAPKIQLDMRLSRLIETYPQTRSIFAAHGLGKLVDEENLPVIGPFLPWKLPCGGTTSPPRTFSNS